MGVRVRRVGAPIRRLMARGVRFADPFSVYVSPGVTVGRGTFLMPGVILRGKTNIGSGCVIGPHTVVEDCVIGDNCIVDASRLYGSALGDHVTVGPYSHVRPGCSVGSGSKIGAFVELKAAEVGQDAKIPHLSYIGDTVVGDRVNIGCGTITANHDGWEKRRTRIDNGAYVGCNSTLIAPVTVGCGAFVAAGSVVTEEVPPDALAIARARQVNKEGRAKGRYRHAASPHSNDA